MGILKEFWFWAAVIGIIYVALMGWHSRFVTRRGRLHSRNNGKHRDNVCFAIAFVVLAIMIAETLWRISHGYHSVVFNAFTEEIFYELILYPFMFFAFYAAILIGVNLLAEILHIGVFQINKEAKQRKRAEEAEAWERHKAAEKQALQRAILLGIARSNNHN